MKFTFIFIIAILFSGYLSGQEQPLQNSDNNQILSLDSLELRLLGAQKAKLGYHPRSIGVTTGISTFLFPPLGLTITTVICSRDVKEKKLDFRDNENKYYIEGLKDESLLIKRRRAWRGVGFGFGALIGLSLSGMLVGN